MCNYHNTPTSYPLPPLIPSNPAKQCNMVTKEGGKNRKNMTNVTTVHKYVS